MAFTVPVASGITLFLSLEEAAHVFGCAQLNEVAPVTP
jgi:hypothetical protein